MLGIEILKKLKEFNYNFSEQKSILDSSVKSNKNYKTALAELEIQLAFVDKNNFTRLRLSEDTQKLLNIRNDGLLRQNQGTQSLAKYKENIMIYK